MTVSDQQYSDTALFVFFTVHCSRRLCEIDIGTIYRRQPCRAQHLREERCMHAEDNGSGPTTSITISSHTKASSTKPYKSKLRNKT